MTMITQEINTLQNKSNTPLVSIIILTYNSEKFILETLESAKQQTYKNIELIISDDCSADNTVTTCETWITENEQFFNRCVLVTTPVNKGIPANCNRGIKASRGTWFKLLAGDDLFFPDCIQNNIEYISKNKNIQFLFSKVEYLIKDSSMKYGQDIPTIDKGFYEAIPNKQYKLLVHGGVFVPAATGFLNKQTIQNLGGFDEDIKLCEDYPMWMKATKNSIKLNFMDQKTVWYRLHAQSVMGSRNLVYEQSMKKVFFKYRFNYLFKNSPILAIDLFFRNISRTNRFWSKIIPLFLPLSYISWPKTPQK
jgi:alpha-1,3-rhamnosyltransferase